MGGHGRTFPGSTFLWKREHPRNTHSEERTINCLSLGGAGRGRYRQSLSQALYAANGRCLMKAFAISLACSVIPFCKQIRWENIFAFGNLVLKNFSRDHCFVLLRKELRRCVHIVKLSALPPCSKQYFFFHFIWECNYPLAFKAWVFILNLIQVLNLGALFLFSEDNSLLILAILLIQHTKQCYPPTQNANAIFF